jgi:CBS domain-containing protein
MKISQTLDKIGNLPYLRLTSDCTLEEAAEKMAKLEQVRGVYVVDDQGRLQGSLSLGVLIRNMMAVRRSHSYVRTLLSHITVERVSDIMDRHVIFATPDDKIEDALDRMVTHNIKEIPIVDEKRRIIGNVGILALWKVVERAAPDARRSGCSPDGAVS